MVAAGMQRVLGIETSCDETAAAVVDGGSVIVSSVVSSQIDLHARYGGVVPELAGRAHVELLTPVLAEALELAGSDPSGAGIDGVAVTYGPGLIGSLLVGLSEAKALSLAWGVPFVGVNHLEAHLFASLLEHPEPGWPMVVLLVSGGHSLLVEVPEPGRYRLLGGTIDDAAGEAFDKVARYLGLGYPGGPAIDRVADEGDPSAFAFPRSYPGGGYDLSFSGLKTAVVRTVEKQPDASTADVAASFRQAVVDVLVTRARRAAADVGARAICLAGGVAANGLLRRRIEDACAEDGIGSLLPSRALCTDNAAMVAAAGWWRLVHGEQSPLGLGADPNLKLATAR
jgi:N6-L-threonylcarbamoyladenine synthase